MKLQEASNFFESLKTETTDKNEIKVYEKFIHILTQLKKRDFTKEEIIAIESKLESFNLKSNPENKRKYFNKALIEFEKYLKETFSLIAKNHYTQIGVALGSALGILFGIIFLSRLERSLGISFGLSIGMFIGLIIGRNMDNKVVAEGKVL